MLDKHERDKMLERAETEASKRKSVKTLRHFLKAYRSLPRPDLAIEPKRNVRALYALPSGLRVEVVFLPHDEIKVIPWRKDWSLGDHLMGIDGFGMWLKEFDK
jgi:hypothetical protein